MCEAGLPAALGRGIGQRHGTGTLAGAAAAAVLGVSPSHKIGLLFRAPRPVRLTADSLDRCDPNTEVRASLVRAAVFKTVGRCDNARSVGSIPMHFRFC